MGPRLRGDDIVREAGFRALPRYPIFSVQYATVL